MDTTINLIREYENFVARTELALGSADEHLHDPRLCAAIAKCEGGAK